MRFQQIRSTPTGAYTYLLGDTEQRVALAIDPVDENLDVLLALVGDLGLQLRFILLTHVHPGTARSAGALRGRSRADIVASAACGSLTAERPVEHGDHIVFGDEVVHVIATPGHTPCSVCYRWRDRVFTGDTLLAGSCGDIAAPGADAGRLFDSVIDRLFALPPETLVFPGFDARGRTVSTIAEEKATNPLFSRRTRDAFMTQLTEPQAAPPLCAPGRQFAGRR